MLLNIFDYKIRVLMMKEKMTSIRDMCLINSKLSADISIFLGIVCNFIRTAVY